LIQGVIITPKKRVAVIESSDDMAIMFVILALFLILIQLTFHWIADNRRITPSQKRDMVEAWLNSPRMLELKARDLARWKKSHPKTQAVKEEESCKSSALCP